MLSSSEKVRPNYRLTRQGRHIGANEFKIIHNHVTKDPDAGPNDHQLLVASKIMFSTGNRPGSLTLRRLRRLSIREVINASSRCQFMWVSSDWRLRRKADIWLLYGFRESKCVKFMNYFPRIQPVLSRVRRSGAC